MASLKIPIRARFWAKVQKMDGCWLWTGAVASTGYGNFFIKKIGGVGVFDRAHRVAWGLTYGPTPDGLHVLHHCDNRRCVRPDHLFLGTNDDNIRDMDAKGRRRNWAKLDDAAIFAIRAQYAAGGVTQRTLAIQYGVCRELISQIVLRRIWRHI